MYMGKDLNEVKLYQSNERKITPVKFYSIPLNKIHSFCDEIGTTCSILFSNDDKTKKPIDGTKN